MRHHAVLVLTMLAAGVVPACSDDEVGSPASAAGAGGTAGMGGSGGMAGTAGMGGSAGMGGGGASGAPAVPALPPTPALPANAPTVACPTTINGALDAADRSQTGRHSRIPPAAACGMPKGAPGNAANPSNPHLYDVYRFSNPTAASVCFNFTLTYGAGGAVAGGLDAGPDAAAPDAGGEGGFDAGDGGVVAPPINAGPARYMTAYSTFFPTDILRDYLGDVGDVLSSPQALGVSVPAGETIDVVVYAIDAAPAGVGSYTLRCVTQ